MHGIDTYEIFAAPNTIDYGGAQTRLAHHGPQLAHAELQAMIGHGHYEEEEDAPDDLGCLTMIALAMTDGISRRASSFFGKSNRRRWGMRCRSPRESTGTPGSPRNQPL